MAGMYTGRRDESGRVLVMKGSLGLYLCPFPPFLSLALSSSHPLSLLLPTLPPFLSLALSSSHPLSLLLPHPPSLPFPCPILLSPPIPPSPHPPSLPFPCPIPLSLPSLLPPPFHPFHLLYIKLPYQPWSLPSTNPQGPLHYTLSLLFP